MGLNQVLNEINLLAATLGFKRAQWLQIVLVLLMIGLLQSYALTVNAMDRSIDDYDRLFARADEITINEITPLHLEGKSVQNAMRELMLKGYRCGRIMPLRGFDFDPTYGCDKYLNEKYCGTATVHFLSNQQIDIASTKYWEQIESVIVDKAGVMCVLPNYLPKSYLINQSTAEAKLSNIIDGLQLKALSGKAVREKLINEYFSCGLDFAKSNAPALVCSKIEPGIPYCHEGAVYIDLEWNKPILNQSDVFENLSDTTVLNVKSKCNIRNSEN